ncbi:MAG: SAM-dependent chlorinase/fluorinase [Bacteroidales bacterium]|nr:SAM-dependent chlorinase/fluorinase [Bacteroidales bacterium]
MPIVTVTSDWKDSSYYLPVLKGRLLSLFAEGKAGNYAPGDLHVENLCSSVEPFNIPQGCFILRNSFRSFPKGSIHLMAVDSEPVEGVGMVAVQYAGHWFVTPNDGRFSLLASPAAIEKGEAVGYEIPLPDKFSTFMASELFARAVSAICRGTFASELQVCGLRSVAGGMPTVLEDRIIGKVVYVDSYGNAITNISRETFARGYMMWRSRNEDDPEFEIYVGGPRLVLDMIHNCYTDVESGMDIALFNWAGLLEFAINRGNFAKVEGVETNVEVMIKFYR